MIKLSDKQRDRMSSILSDMGKITATAFVVGQFLPGARESLNSQKLVLGSVVTIMCWIFSVVFAKEGSKNESI